MPFAGFGGSPQIVTPSTFGFDAPAASGSVSGAQPMVLAASPPVVKLSAAIVTLQDCPVPYKILYAPQATLESEDTRWTAEMAFMVSYDDMAIFSTWAEGLIYRIDLGGGSYADRVIPVTHPKYGRMTCYQVKAAATGTYNPDTGENWDYARVVLSFATRPWVTNDGSIPFLDIEVQGSREEYTLPGTGYYFPSDNAPIKQDASFGVATASYVYTLYQVPTFNETLLKSMAGTLNLTTFLSHAPGTFRMDTFNRRSNQTGSGQVINQISIVGTWRAIHWNWFLRPDGIWEAPKKTVDNTYAYAFAEHNQLLQ